MRRTRRLNPQLGRERRYRRERGVRKRGRHALEHFELRDLAGPRQELVAHVARQRVEAQMRNVVGHQRLDRVVSVRHKPVERCVQCGPLHAARLRKRADPGKRCLVCTPQGAEVGRKSPQPTTQGVQLTQQQKALAVDSQRWGRVNNERSTQQHRRDAEAGCVARAHERSASISAALASRGLVAALGSILAGFYRQPYRRPRAAVVEWPTNTGDPRVTTRG